MTLLSARTHSCCVRGPFRGVFAAVVIAPGPSGQLKIAPHCRFSVRVLLAEVWLQLAPPGSLGSAWLSLSAPKINFSFPDSHAARQHFLAHERGISFVCFQSNSQGYTCLIYY